MQTTANTVSAPEMTPEVSLALPQATLSIANVTSYLYPNPKVLWMVLPRMISRAGSFACITVPEHIESILGLGNGGRIIAEATREGAQDMASIALPSAGLVNGTASDAAGVLNTEAAGGQRGYFGHGKTLQQIKNFGGLFTYITSKWALGCFTVVSFVLLSF